MTVLTELNQMINLLEAQIPANPGGSRNLKFAKDLERSLRDYFGLLGGAFPYDQIALLYYRYVRESIRTDAGDFIDPLLNTLTADLTYRLNGHLATIYMSASTEMVTWGKTKGGIPIAYEGPPMGEAITWADKHCATLVKGLNTETKDRLARVISDGIKEKRGVDGLARDIRREFDNMTTYRSRMIARTETADALSQASLDRMQEMGIEGKQWVRGSSYPCDICDGNEADGVIPINQAFSSGHLNPPGHPNCVCALAPARLGK